jgi:hypothetical protein
MGTITRSFANNITTSGVLLPASLNNNSIANVTAYNASVATGGMKLISSQTASNSASLSFTTGIDSTYKEYQFWFMDIHPRTDGNSFGFNLSTDSGSNYNVTKTSIVFRAYHDEADTATIISLAGNENNLAQSTGVQFLTTNGVAGDADITYVGTLTLFNPSSTTYVKHYIANSNTVNANDYSINAYLSGYANTTSAINAIRFTFDVGNFDGTILMYGIV